MGFSENSEGVLVYTMEIEINLLDVDPKYPKHPKNFGETLRKKRMDLGLTMKELAQRAGVTETTVYYWGVRNIRPYKRIGEKLKTILKLNKEVPV